MELTKEHFDEIVKHLATKKDLENVASKKQIEGVSRQIEELARMTSHGFEDVLERLDVRDRVTKVEAQLLKISQALDLKL